MTVLAYLPSIDDAYVREFRARVVALPPGAVVLDRTYFYPTGGGQPSDLGTLDVADGGRLEVVDVTRSGPSVLHRVRGPPAAVRAVRAGAEVGGTIDWDRRHRHMRLHTGQHLLSARIFARWGRRTRKASLAGTKAVLDLEGGLPDEGLAVLESDLGEAVSSPRPVVIRQIPRADWDRHPLSARSGLVPLAPTIDPVRVIDIEGLDVCPCGGTHLRSTGEIGSVALQPPTPLPDGGTRVTFTLEPGAGPAPRA
jgi:misacylated tRNA(Ala) deacylase